MEICFLCKSRQRPFFKLKGHKLKFFRKPPAFKNFKESSLLCEKCYKEFDKIYQRKKDGKKKAHSTLSSKTSSIASTNLSSSNGSQEKVSNLINDTPSSISNLISNTNSMSPARSIDSTDRLVQLVPSILSLRDSSSRTIDPGVVLARERAAAAEKSALKRKRTPERVLPNVHQTPTSTRRLNSDEELSSSDEDIQTFLTPNDLSRTRPVVKRRKEPVVYFDQRVMDVYLANTSGG